ncbi:MAG: flagellar basal body L-ring protein FlgH [Ferrovibrio sp.]|uniref:flagellar basal body L-ring protein FlgH n=1 Tax=Ferrovibrio sp. TaxID=1917215 RepID=UPI002634CEB2|nr:flagellar basal body L-ring protein FlgH [Ferrovibrio sp.]MCW0234229.1 flagellar basal body L-ring protein FlgH [Ferrovibrio sp.]
MTRTHMPSLASALRIAATAGLAITLGACGNLSRLGDIGSAPSMSKIDNPTESRDYRPVSLPMPSPEVTPRHANSLWRPGARQFFKDPRATRVGDILTVNINIQERAQLQNNTTTSRDNSETQGLPNFLGWEAARDGAGGVLTGAGAPSTMNKIFRNIDPENMVTMNSASEVQGKGQVTRNEQITLTVAGLVTQVLPNGNLVVQGRQEVRVNNEVRELLIQGIVRPEDITATNTVNHTQMAEARISYGGRGQLTDVQQGRWGQQIYDIIFPF